MKKIAQTICGALCLASAFAVGYVIRPFGPSVSGVADRVGLRPPVRAQESREPSPAPAAPMDAQAALALLGSYTSEISTRIEELRARRKEKEIAIQLLTNRGETADSAVLRRLTEQQQVYGEQIVELEAMVQETLDVEQRLQRFVDAEADVEGALVEETESLTDARAVLARLEFLGSWPQ